MVYFSNLNVLIYFNFILIYFSNLNVLIYFNFILIYFSNSILTIQATKQPRIEKNSTFNIQKKKTYIIHKKSSDHFSNKKKPVSTNFYYINILESVNVRPWIFEYFIPVEIHIGNAFIRRNVTLFFARALENSYEYFFRFINNYNINFCDFCCVWNISKTLEVLWKFMNFYFFGGWWIFFDLPNVCLFIYLHIYLIKIIQPPKALLNE